MAGVGPRAGNRVSTSLGRALPGMQNVGANASSNIRPSPELEELVDEAARENGCVKIEIVAKDAKMVGKKLFRIKVEERSWQEKMDALADKVDDKTPCIFVLFRSAADCLLIKYIPDLTPVRLKMLYASSMSSVKEMIYQSGKVAIEEYNPSSVDELNSAEYQKQRDVEAPLTEAEIMAKEYEQAEKVGGDSLLARLQGKGAQPIALPGMKLSEQGAAMLARMASTAAGKKDEDDDEDVGGADDVAEDAKSADDDDDGAGAADEEAEAAKNAADDNENDPPSPEDAVKAKRASSSAGKGLLRRLSGPRRSASGSGGDDKKSSSSARKSKSKSKKAAPAADADDEIAPDDPNQYPYTLADLLKMKQLGEFDDNMDVTQLEIYMTNAAFHEAFAMSKEKFAKLPAWKKKNLKKQVGLF